MTNRLRKCDKDNGVYNSNLSAESTTYGVWSLQYSTFILLLDAPLNDA